MLPPPASRHVSTTNASAVVSGSKLVASTCWNSASVRLALLTSAAAVHTGLDGQLDARQANPESIGANDRSGHWTADGAGSVAAQSRPSRGSPLPASRSS